MFQNMLRNVKVKFEPIEEESKSGDEDCKDSKIDDKKSDDDVSLSGESKMSSDLFTQEMT